ncbi:hypothetical protein ID866_5228 [Astraeus odoratus]|nr:hypothetical protein ID866_5228 [Astraeus odoratus]
MQSWTVVHSSNQQVYSHNFVWAFKPHQTPHTHTLNLKRRFFDDNKTVFFAYFRVLLSEMTHQNHIADANAAQNKPTSRFASLRVFKLKPGSGSTDSQLIPPPPPPKDNTHATSPNPALNPPSAFYSKSLFSRSAVSLSPSVGRAPSQGQSTGTDSGPATPLTPGSLGGPEIARLQGSYAYAGSHGGVLGRGMTASPVPSGSGISLSSVNGGGEHATSLSADGSTDSSGSLPTNPNPYALGAFPSQHTEWSSTKRKKSLFKLSSLGKKNKSRRDLSESASECEESGREEGDEGISKPWNFQHHIHVDEGYIGLPPSWTAALSNAGFTEEEISTIHSRRQAASAANLKNGPSATGTSPAPSPRTTSFGVRLVGGGLRMSRAGDSLSVTSESRSRSGSVNGTGEVMVSVGEESEQYVMVEGDGPDAGDGMGDETLIEPFPFDAASVSTHQNHSPAVQSMHMQVQTPRGPHVQPPRIDTGNVPFPSAGTPIGGMSPLLHSPSLSIPASRGYATSTSDLSVRSSIHRGTASPSPSPSHSLPGRPGPPSSTPRTPPRRIYHVVNASSDSYGDPPPAYVSPARGQPLRREKEGSQESTCAGPSSPPPPSRPIPSIPVAEPANERSQVSEGSHSARYTNASRYSPDGRYDIDPFDASDIPATVEDVLDISAANSSLYIDDVQEEAHEDYNSQRRRLLAPTPPLVIDKRLTRLGGLSTQPPRISFHQEGSLDDWTSSLFNVIGGSDVVETDRTPNSSAVPLSRKKHEDEKANRRATLRPMSPIAQKAALLPTSPAPKLPDVSFGANISLGAHARQATIPTAEGREETMLDTVDEVSDHSDEPPSPTPSTLLPDVSLGPSVSSLEKVLAAPVTPVTSIATGPRSNADSAPTSTQESEPPAPRVKPKPSLPSLVPPKANTTGVDGKALVSPLYNKPLPLPLPIPPDQIRAQLRPPKLDDIRASSQPQAPESQAPASQIQTDTSQLDPFSQPGSRLSSSSTLLPKSNAGDRDSGMSTVTVTPATIVVVKGQAVRRAVASVIDPDRISLASLSNRDSVASAFGVTHNCSDSERDKEAYYAPQDGEQYEVSCEAGDDVDTQSLAVSGRCSRPSSSPSPTWPAPPPPPVELDTEATPRPVSRFRTTSLLRLSQMAGTVGGVLSSPRTAHFSHLSSETSSTCESVPLTSPKGGVLPPSPLMGKAIAPEARMLVSKTDTFGGVDIESEDEVESGSTSSSKGSAAPSLRSLASSQTSLRASVPPLPSQQTRSPFPLPRKPETLHPLLAPLHSFISPLDPSTLFTDLVEIAEGESGSVYAARVPQELYNSVIERPIPAGASHVAIKRIALPLVPPAGTEQALLSVKMTSLLHELTLLKDVDNEYLLLLDGVYVHTSADVNDGDELPRSGNRAIALDTSLWIRMELMERSLADVIALVAEGLALQERMVGRFTSDVLLGLEYLQKQRIAHRDVRSDNLLLNAAGMVKIADFSNAIRVPQSSSTVTGAVGVIYWQAPEMRAGPYNALKVDVWSVGATVWELAETVPPFSIPASPHAQTAFSIPNSKDLCSQWPPLSHPEHYSKAFREFLRLCGMDAAARPSPAELLETQFIRNACGRPVIRQLLTQCRAMEEAMIAIENANEPR